ncbi:hypothetical protein L7F22_033893 [Adiantum nelumboides]|nr:hypothetical protein [Adiantum nelumboides]
MHRDAEKLYGRKFLLRHHPDQYRVLLSNYGEVGKWFAKVDSIGDLRNNLEQKNHVLSIIKDKIGNLKDIVIDGAFYPWKEEDIYSWCIKSLASKRKYSKKKIDQSMSSSSGSMPINQDLDDEGVGDLHEKVTDLHQDAPLDKTIENAQDDNDLVKLDDMGAIMAHEKEKEEEKSAHEDVEVYIPKIPWENNNNQNDAYEEYQKFIRDESFGVALKVKDSYVIPHDDDHNYVKNKEMKDDTSSELCDVNIDLSSRKSARKRKATSKLLELLKKKEKVLRVSKNKNKKELPRESRESTIQSSSLETKSQVGRARNILSKSRLAINEAESVASTDAAEGVHDLSGFDNLRSVAVAVIVWCCIGFKVKMDRDLKRMFGTVSVHHHPQVWPFRVVSLQNGVQSHSGSVRL